MNAVKALVIAGVVTALLFLIIVWIIPIIIFVVVFAAIAIIANAFFEAKSQNRRPP